MRVIERLFWEHDIILTMLDAMSNLIGKLDAGDPVLLADLDTCTSFLKDYCDGIHHFREEEILFPALERSANLKHDSGPLAVMLSDHQYGHERLREMTEYQKAAADGSRKPLELWAHSAREYIKMISPHIQKENIVLYRMAEKHCDAESIAKLDTLSDAHDKKTEKEAKHLSASAALFRLKYL